LRARFKAEEKSRAAIWLGFGPDLAAVAMNDSLHGGQTDARPREILLPVKALKDSEQLIGIFWIEAHPVIPDEENRHAASLSRTYFNYGQLPRFGEFHGVREKINEN